MQEEIKVCPNCRGEYYSHIEQCADCSVDLVLKSNTEISHKSIDDTTELVLIRTDEALFIKDFQRKLDEIGIQSIISVEYHLNTEVHMVILEQGLITQFM